MIKLRDCQSGRWIAFNPDDLVLVSLRGDRKIPELSLHLMRAGTVVHESIYLPAQLEEGDGQFGDSGLASEVFEHLVLWPQLASIVPNPPGDNRPGAVIPKLLK